MYTYSICRTRKTVYHFLISACHYSCDCVRTVNRYNQFWCLKQHGLSFEIFIKINVHDGVKK